MKARKIIGIILLAGASIISIWAVKYLDINALTQWVDGLGPLAWLGFMLLYAIATVLFLPGSVLTLAGGSLFGPWLGTFVNLTGATLGAALSFLIARHLAGDWVEHKASGQMKRLKDGVEQEGWRFVAFVRLVPLFPFNLLNYALGLTRIPFGQYLTATYACMLPGALAYTYLGYAGREALSGGEDMIQKGLLALALLASVVFLPRMVARLRGNQDKGQMGVEALRNALSSPLPPLLLDVRTAADFNGPLGHIAQARNLPLEAIGTWLEELRPYADQPIALICTTDRRSAKAAELLRTQGFAQVSVVAKGMKEWGRLKLPVAIPSAEPVYGHH